ncbi:D-isomer specific 2-hydroxyacid dehydrogenase family protein [Nocardioides terrisoli]|uniref:D-isomer specific 2-hydroxyacid dehydrogenase family protein n=1 Tax=Nocardioides terrisoli TaxID=3388267 RepID=UPI00287BA477|nr:D-isomer specific 2-hydroxyacid dehydrogenase family protein [Nocardioides marmorisolisilvae]
MICSEEGVIDRDVRGGRRVPRLNSSKRVASHTSEVTVYGCSQDEAALFDAVGASLGVSPRIVEAPVCEANVNLARGSRCVSVSHKAPVTNAALLALSGLGVEYVSTRSIGCNHVDVDYAARVGISVGTVDYSPGSVADYTLMLMLMAVRHAKAGIRRTDGHDYTPNSVRGRELRDLTIGVVGTGRIGTAVIDRLRGFGCRVLAHDAHPRAGVEYVPLDDLVACSDIITLHTPLTVGTHHLLDRRRIQRMRPGAYVVNTGRGSLLDTQALLAALESGRLGGAALDVIEGEEGVFYTDCRNRHIENDALLRLQELPNVLISPHCAYDTDHALSDIVENTLHNCLAFERGRAA